MTAQKTITPQTASEARALASRLEAAERDLDTKRRAARKAAEIDACRDILDAEADDRAKAADLALTEWKAAVDDDSVGLAELFVLWCNVRRTSAVRATTVAQASSAWDDLEPIKHPVSGQPVTHRADTHDSLAPRGELTWALAVEDVIQRRTENARTATETKVRGQIVTAGLKAAEAVTT